MFDIHITVHATERFIERHRPDLSYNQALTYLIENAPSASPLKERTYRGHQQRVLEEPYCILVIKHDKALRKNICVTILPEPENNDPIPEEEMEMIRERVACDLKAQQSPPAETLSRALTYKPTGTRHSLIQPSPNTTAEEMRVKAEERLWNRAFNVYEQQEKQISRMETHYLQENRNQDDLRKCIRYLVQGIRGTEQAYLLEFVEENAPHFMGEDFLRSET